MNIGSLVRLTESAKLSIGIEDVSSDTFCIIVDRIDLAPMFDIYEESVIGYKVLVPGQRILEIIYGEDMVGVECE